MLNWFSALPKGKGGSMTWEILLLGFAVGVVSGVIGIGGGVLLVPLLVWRLGMDQHKAQGTSLAALLLPTGIFAFWTYYRQGNADLRVGLLVAAGFAAGGLFGGVAAAYLCRYADFYRCEDAVYEVGEAQGSQNQ
jgi:uncharacterized membrane protein YfcA